jgi:hypothetical protein
MSSYRYVKGLAIDIQKIAVHFALDIKDPKIFRIVEAMEKYVDRQGATYERVCGGYRLDDVVKQNLCIVFAISLGDDAVALMESTEEVDEIFEKIKPFTSEVEVFELY